MNGIFITGTDTGVGKTYVACRIAEALRRSGAGVGVMKPAETGCRKRNGSLVPADALALTCAAGVDDPIDLVNPYRFEEPLAPAVAAERAGGVVSLAVILKAYRKLAHMHRFMIVEGAGGILVPLTARNTYLDLAEQLALPVVVVARPGLGTINHSLLTIMALRSRGVTVAGIVINHSVSVHQGPAERTNPAIIQKMSGVPVLDTIYAGQKRCSALVRRISS